MIYVVIAMAVVGLVVILTGRVRVAPTPVCPNCKAELESLEVERCDQCLLWMPPEFSQTTVRWTRRRLVLGLLVMTLPAVTYTMVPLIIDITFAPDQTSSSTVLPPVGGPAQTWQRMVGNLTPQEIGQLQSLGYLQSPVSRPRGATSGPADPSRIDPALLKKLRALGYFPPAGEDAASTGD